MKATATQYVVVPIAVSSSTLPTWQLLGGSKILGGYRKPDTEPRIDHVLQISDFVFANEEGRVAELVFKETGDFFCRNGPDSRGAA